MSARIRKAMKEEDGGFTLVELIVVVVIIGVLAAIAVPVYLDQTAKAKLNADLATLAVAKIALAAYSADKGSGAVASPTTAQLQPYGFPTSPVMVVHDVNGPNGYFVIEMKTTSGALTTQSGKACVVRVTASDNTLGCSG